MPACLGDGWLPIGGRPPATLPPKELAAGFATLREQARRVGRDPAAIPLGFSTGVALADTPADSASERDAPARRRPFHGTPEEVAADLRRYCAVGVECFVLGFGAAAPDQLVARLRRFAEQVRPAVAAG